jgi:hypothetical protein
MPKNIRTNFILPKFSLSSRSFNRVTSVAHNITPYQVFLICSEKLINQGSMA